MPANDTLEEIMHLLLVLLNPGVIGVLALFLSIIWMLRDEKDKTRPLLVFALILNLFFGFLLTIFMSREGGLLPWKYDHVLFALDRALGLTAAPIAGALQGFFRIPLIVIYQLMVPMMIAWFLVTEYRNTRGSVVLAYVARVGCRTRPVCHPACLRAHLCLRRKVVESSAGSRRYHQTRSNAQRIPFPPSRDGFGVCVLCPRKVLARRVAGIPLGHWVSHAFHWRALRH